jgi:Ca2+-binding EF-hand superfamily protein
VLIKKKKELLEQQIEEKKKSGLTNEQIQEIKDNFEYFDKNKSGYLDKRELRGALTSLGEESSKAAVDQVLKTYDADGDGKVDYKEFEKFMFTKLGDTNSIEEIKQSFEYITLQQDFINLEQLESVVNEVSFRSRHVQYLKKEMKPKKTGLDWPTWTKEVFDR